MSSRVASRLAFLGSLGVLGLVGCGGDAHGRDEDAAITFDARPPGDGGPDTGTDAGTVTPPEGSVGAMCSGDTECEGGFCIPESEGFRDGYCTADCGGMDCPAGSTCVPVGGGTSLCLDDCDPGATARECRTGYGCATSFMVPNVCLPGCTDDSDCTDGNMCDPEGGGAGAGVCYDPSAMTGDACQDESMCPAGTFCQAEQFSGWPGGACIGPECDPTSGEGCMGTDVCLPTMGGGVCAHGCETDADCRDAYSCRPSADFPDRMYCGPACTMDSQCTATTGGGAPYVCNPGLGTCGPPFDPDRLGASCMGRRSCPGGTCLREFDSGFPGAYCTYVGCDLDAPDAMDGCPADGVCIAAGDGTTGFCLDGCTTDTDCRDGYACRPSDPADGASPTACVPACTDDAQCANDGFVCNAGTGRCTEPFDPSFSGQPCETGEDCPGGTCLSEGGSGWPGGACLYPGCRLSGTGGSETCPMGSACVDDGSGDPEIGVCATTCMVAGMPTGCRAGYLCTPDTGMPTSGTCTPHCATDADCTGGGTCNVTSGLCE